MNDNSVSFGSALRSSWALLLGFGVLMLGDGLQGTLLAVRADMEGFSATVTGMVMSTFYAGFLIGSITCPRITAKVGHIRVFAALAAMASAAILVHALFVNVSVWTLLRFVSGFCFAGLYIVAESWLNDSATNRNRGKLLSMYMIVTYVGVGAGQLLLNLASPADFPLFILTSVLISIAVVPLLLSAGSPPKFRESVKISLVELYRISPLGIVSMFVVGMVTATFFALAPVYGQRSGLDVREISYLMTAAVVGTVALQGPIGALSDHFDRRMVLTVVSLLTALSALLAIVAIDYPFDIQLLSIALFGGMAFPLYSVCIAYTNDHLKPNQMIAASGALVLVGGFGAITGPVMVAAMMDYFGDSYLFIAMATAHLIVGLFGMIRMMLRPPVPLDRQCKSYTTAVHPSGAAIESMQQYASSAASEKSDAEKPT